MQEVIDLINKNLLSAEEIAKEIKYLSEVRMKSNQPIMNAFSEYYEQQKILIPFIYFEAWLLAYSYMVKVRLIRGMERDTELLKTTDRFMSNLSVTLENYTHFSEFLYPYRNEIITNNNMTPEEKNAVLVYRDLEQ